MSINNNCKIPDILIVGCGFTGSIIAYLAAKRLNKKVLIIDKRNHIGGNMYDEYDENTGILVQKYGPHSFHTNNKDVFKLLREIGEWEPFVLRARAEIKGELTPSPFNFTTIEQYFTCEQANEIKTHLCEKYDYQSKATIVDMLHSEDKIISEYAKFLFEQDYRPYTSKQWGIQPEELDISILKRVPVRLSYIDQYFDDQFQVQPKNGYTEFFYKMLDVDGIEIRLSTNARDILDIKDNNIYFEGEKLNIPVIYTGPLDELFDCKFGKLPYRSLSFEYKTLDTPTFQPTPGVAYPFADGYTRVTEFSKLMTCPPKTDKTIVAYEYPEVYGSEKGKEPYYPILTENSINTYQKYVEIAKNIQNLYPCGRLGNFKYYNMDNAIESAISIFENLKWQ